MPIDQLLFDHQLAKLNLKQAQSRLDRDTYLHLVGYYANRITKWRRAAGLPESGWPRDERTGSSVHR